MFNYLIVSALSEYISSFYYECSEFFGPSPQYYGTGYRYICTVLLLATPKKNGQMAPAQPHTVWDQKQVACDHFRVAHFILDFEVIPVNLNRKSIYKSVDVTFLRLKILIF